MKVVIRADGPDLRFPVPGNLSKPLVEIGGRPLIWHIMKIYAAHGISDFILCCAENAADIKNFFAGYAVHAADVTFDLTQKSAEIHHAAVEDWRVTVVDMGPAIASDRSLSKVAAHLEGEDAFCLCYGDSLSSIDIGASLAFHRSHGRQATVSAVYPPAQHGALHLDGTEVRALSARPEAGFVNGGFLVLSPSCLDTFGALCLPDHRRAGLDALAQAGQLRAYLHEGFWQPVETRQDVARLEGLWKEGTPPWKVW
ncbi:glucose-1-phosphate cytidylyltransferase [Rhizobium sp. Leaf384]|uniref:hypothetical protein n=1 Tax=unclassified Rhizobium TaxID=2613769 RepID=UPI000715977A|nr:MULTISPECIES: hypothetical protein [unclassified Rhizobium]KQS81030.1 glucose-1-phosphate cytidylyltransferase [Rhizobium sp. Leaf384]KQS86884.1 glucose-1-phosphate cytidylyltransferase [Rhizobium sp. Leaf383]